MRRWVRNLVVALLLLFPALFVSVTYLEDVSEANGQLGSGGIIPFVTGLPVRVIGLASGAGYLGVFVLMLMEAAAFPIPSEIILPFAGYLVSQGKLDFWPVVFISTLAALIGSLIDYYLGWKLGGRLLNSKIRFVHTAHLGRAHTWFNRYGTIAVALFRLVPAARVLISFPAGAYRMSRSKFAIYTLAGCLPWNFILVYLGWWLGSSWGTVVEAFRYINLVVYVFLILFVVWIAWKLTSRRSPRSRSVLRSSALPQLRFAF